MCVSFAGAGSHQISHPFLHVTAQPSQSGETTFGKYSRNLFEIVADHVNGVQLGAEMVRDTGRQVRGGRRRRTKVCSQQHAIQTNAACGRRDARQNRAAADESRARHNGASATISSAIEPPNARENRLRSRVATVIRSTS